MKEKFIVALRFWWSVIVGGASTSAMSYLSQAGLTVDASRVDWHKVGQLAAVGAVVAVISHAAKSPLQKEGQKDG